MNESLQSHLRRLPSVDELLRSESFQSLLSGTARTRLVEVVRETVGEIRKSIIAGDLAAADLTAQTKPEVIARRVEELLAGRSSARLLRVLNASGVIVHTNLGRSKLARSALDHAAEAALQYSNLEYNLESGARGSRQDHIQELLGSLTGAPAAMVVNNNAAAVLLMLSALAAGREVVVSRGQLIEIGASFRIPDIMRLSGARLVEVGTTNKTRPSDYEAAITTDTALLFRAHTSNFKVVGFAEEVPIEALCNLGRTYGVPVADDLGSGALAGLPALAAEPSAKDSLAAGVEVLSFSGDKLLGGPQAGILLGSKQAIEVMEAHPLARVVRVDKMTLGALEGTLLLYQDPDKAAKSIPTLRYLDRGPEETGRLAKLLRATLEETAAKEPIAAHGGAKAFEFGIRETIGRAGGGSLPLLEIPSHAVTVKPVAGSVADLVSALHRVPIPLIGRVTQDVLLLDVLTLDEEEFPLVAESLRWTLESGFA